MRPRVLLTFDAEARRNYYDDASIAALRSLGEVRLNDSGAPLAGDALIRTAQGCQVIVSDRQAAAPADLFGRLPALAVFMRCAVDIRNVDVQAASDAGVLVTRASAGFDAAVAEWIVGAMIDLSRHISDGVVAYRGGAAAQPAMGRELRGATLGVLGYGAIGRYLCRLGVAFGMRVVVADPHARADDPAIEQLGIDDVVAAADHLVCLVPANAETENLIDDALLARMKRGAFFVNAARGEVVDEAALLRALDDGRLTGCALDVGRAPDQMPSPRLAAHPRVIASPHIGGLTPQAAAHQSRETVEQLRELLAGRMPQGAVNAGHARRLHLLH